MNRKTLNWIALVAAVVAVAAGLTCLYLTGHKTGDENIREKSAPGRRVIRSKPKSERQDPKEAVQDVVSKRRIPQSRLGEKPGFEAFLDELSTDDRKLVLSVQDALDENNFSAVARAARHALESTNLAVREAAVEALGWFGAEALPDLTPLMADSNDDVAEAAMSQWELALGEIEEPAVKAEIAEAVMKTLTNKDALQSIISEITSQDDDLVILESLVAIIESDNAVGAEVAREEYETMTGEEWTDIDAANRWLEENYDPSESDHEGKD